MKTKILSTILFLTGLTSFGQSVTIHAYLDSMKTVFYNTDDIVIKISSGKKLASSYTYLNPDSTIYFAQQTIDLAKSKKMLNEQIWSMAIMGEGYMNKANLPKTLELALGALEISKNIDSKDVFLGPTYYNLSDLYFQIGDLKKARFYALASIEDPRLENEELNQAYGYFLLSQVLEKEQKPDSAMQALELSFKQFSIFKDNFFRSVYGQDAWPGLYNLRAKILLQLNKPQEALNDLNKILTLARFSDEPFHAANSYNDIALFYKKYSQPDSTIKYALKALKESEKISYDRAKVLSLELLSEVYESKDPVKALYYYKLATEAKNRLFGSGNIQILREMVVNEEKRTEEIALAKKESQANLRLYLMAFGLLSVLIIAFILFRNNRTKMRANEVLEIQKNEIEDALKKLKSTQAQLIQSEKMASLGELTAGIAHEIQNPLNFVNNFSEVSSEMIDEMKEELAKGDLKEVEAISDDLKQNLEKINHHGNRASSIVKGMLEHSKTSSGKKELIDINALADEYLRLSYHGLRAKDKDFNAEIATDFDPSLPKIEVIPQDIGRVLLNLINNAFQAVMEKASMPEGLEGRVDEESSASASKDYKPTVSVSTQLTANSQKLIAIKIKDNGPGIPDSIKDKIFQPFFTTKDTGKGTGLGLSLAYDIVKAHGGELMMQSKEGEGSEFIIQLPAV